MRGVDSGSVDSSSFDSGSSSTRIRSETEIAGRRGASAGTVLRAILEHGPVARSTIARLTGLSPSSVTGHSAQLVRLGLIRESRGPTRSNGMGRPHVPVDLDTARYVVAAVHIAVQHSTIALLDLRGRVVAQRLVRHSGTDPARIVDRAVAVLAAMLDEYGHGAVPLGLGVATGGWVDQQSGTVIEHSMLGWRDVPLRELFAERTASPVYVDGHSRALLQAERLFGAARGRGSVIHLFVGNVVDAAFAADGRVHYGPRSQAGAIAHLPLDGNAERCPCGRVGCLQAAVTDTTLARRAFDEGVIAAPDFAPLFEAARAGDPGAARIFAERARWVGQATAMLLDVFDPELVVVVEPGVMHLPGSLAALHRAVRERVWSSSLDVPRTVVSTSFGDDVLAVAGGSVVLEALYRDPLALLA